MSADDNRPFTITTLNMNDISVIDEEIGSLLGMELFVQHEVFKKFNVGFVLGESIPSETEEYTIFTGERSAWCKPS